MNQISITAVFSNYNTARRAADTLALSQGQGLTFTLSMRNIHGAATKPHFQSFFQNTITEPTMVHQNHSCLLRATCSPNLESFVVGELAALGAEKVEVHAN